MLERLCDLQNHVKRDPGSYRDEFERQRRRFLALVDLLRLRPAMDEARAGDAAQAEELEELALFLAQCAPFYEELMRGYPKLLCELLEAHAGVLVPAVRRGFASALILMRNRNLVAADVLLPLFFRLLRVRDKVLRTQVSHHIVADIRRANRKHRNEVLNKRLQNFLYSMVGDGSELAAKRSMDIMVQLFRRNVWPDERTVNVIASAVFSPFTRVCVAALKFMLGVQGSSDLEGGRDVYEAEAEDERRRALADVLRNKPSDRAAYIAKKQGTHSSKKKKARKAARLAKSIQRHERAVGEDINVATASVILAQIRDPQGFAEKLFAKLRGSNERFETRLLMMNVVSRLIGAHELILLNFYPFLQRYMQPHQQHVTLILSFAAQAVHDMVPPDAVEPLVKVLSNNFVTDRSSPPEMTIGLNTVREILKRCPLAVDDTLLQDLTGYKKYRDKGVVSAARSLIQLYRELNPSLLEKKDRGKEAQMAVHERKPRQFGETKATDTIDGLDLLEDEGARDGGGGISADDEGEDVLGSADELSDMEFDSDDDAPGVHGARTAGATLLDEEEDDDGEDEEEDDEEEDDDEAEGGSDDMDEDDDNQDAEEARKAKAAMEADPESLASLKRQLASLHKPPAQSVAATRILTDEDFERLRHLKASKAKSAVAPKGRERARLRALQADREAMGEDEDEEVEGDDADEDLGPEGGLGSFRVTAAGLETGVKRRREHDYDSRLATVIEGREGREKFGGKKQHAGGSTNAKKRKGKPLMGRINSRAFKESKAKSTSGENYRKSAAKGRDKNFGRKMGRQIGTKFGKSKGKGKR